MEDPTEEGWYAFKLPSEWPLQLRQVQRGNWRLTQDPDLLYASAKEPVGALVGWWFGPLPEAGSLTEFVAVEAPDA